MREQLLVGALGAVIEIDLSLLDDSARAATREAWADATLAHGREPDAVVSARRDLADMAMLQALASDVTRVATDLGRGNLWMLECMAFANDNGRVIALVADAETRADLATTLSARFDCVSDEVIGIDAEGGVRTYRKPLSGTAAHGQVSPSSGNGGRQVSDVFRLSKILILEPPRDDRSIAEQDGLLPSPEALPLLVSKSPHIDALRGALRSIHSILDLTGGVARFGYRDRDGLFSAMTTLFDVSAMAIRPMVSPSTHSKVPDDVRTRSAIFRGPVLDQLTLADGRVALMHRDRRGVHVAVLDPASSRAWSAAAGVTREQLRNAVAIVPGSFCEDVGADLAEKSIDRLKHRGFLRDEPSWRVTDGAAWTSSGSRTTVLNLDRRASRPMVLDGTASVIWSLFADGLALSQDQLLHECGHLFEIEPATIADDVIDLLLRLRDEGVLESV